VEAPGRTGQRLVTFLWQAGEHLQQHILAPAPPIWEDFRVLDEFGKRKLDSIDQHAAGNWRSWLQVAPNSSCRRLATPH